MGIYIPLHGTGPTPKAPSEKAWSSEDYLGVGQDHGGWVGLRCDGLVVIDCDSAQAISAWESIGAETYTVKTPRGMHYYYHWVYGAPTGPATNVLPGTDVRAGRGSYVVAPPTPGYIVTSDKYLNDFDPTWIPSKSPPELPSSDEGWDTIPAGERNDTLTRLAGGLRRQGMDADTIAATMLWWNKYGLVNPPLSKDEIVAIAHSVSRYKPEPDMDIDLRDVPLDSVFLDMRTMELPPPAEWHWKPYFPKGRLVLLDGSEGIGKGLLCAKLATDWAADGHTGLWASTEDDPEEDVQKRLLASGYQRDLIGTVLFFKVNPKLPHDATVLEYLIHTTNASFMFLDPGRSFLAVPGNQNMNYNDDAMVRPGLEALNKLAKRTGCTIIFVHHWNKNTATTTQYRAGGSAAFAQVVRHRVTMGWVGPTTNGEGAFEVSKSNIGPRGAVHTYTIEPVEEYDTARFVLGEPEPGFSDLAEWVAYIQDENSSIQIDPSDDIISDILALSPGEKIPSRNDIASKYGVKRSLAQQIRDELENSTNVRSVGKMLYRADPDNERVQDAS